MLLSQNPDFPTLEKISETVGIELPNELSEPVHKQTGWRRLIQRYPREYFAFIDMHRSVSDPTHPKYARCGGAGIKVHPSWANTPEGFMKFLDDMGPCPD
jgi:hypothetical protein